MLLLASRVDFPVFHKLNSKKFRPLLLATMNALPSAEEADCECNQAAAVGQFSIQQPWQWFLEVHTIPAQTYCVITQKVEPWDLIWTSVPLCHQSPPFRTKLRGNIYLPINNQTECRAFFPPSRGIPLCSHFFLFIYLFRLCCRFLHFMILLSQEKDAHLAVSSK